jgi:hypothetical protein
VTNATSASLFNCGAPLLLPYKHGILITISKLHYIQPSSSENQHRKKPSHPINQPPKMANFLASIFGTELDKVNCSFYFVSLFHCRARPRPEQSAREEEKS